MSFKTKPKSQFDNRPQPRQRPVERLMPPDLVFETDEDEKPDSLKRLTSAKQQRRPKHTEKSGIAD